VDQGVFKFFAMECVGSVAHNIAGCFNTWHFYVIYTLC